MLYNATINVNPNEYPDEDAMVDDIMTNLEGYHPAISDSTDFPGMIDVVVTIEAKSPSEAMAWWTRLEFRSALRWYQQIRGTSARGMSSKSANILAGTHY